LKDLKARLLARQKAMHDELSLSWLK